MVASQLGTPYVQAHITETSFRGGLFVKSRMREIVRYADEWSMTFEDLVPEWEQDPRVRVVCYEVLTRDPETEIQSICDFLGETYEESMLSGRTEESVPMHAGRVSSEQLEQWRREHHAKSLRPVSTDSLDNWKNSLSPIEIQVVETRCEGGMRGRGYVPSTSVAERFRGRLFARAFIAAEQSESRARKAYKSIRSRMT